jgi:hypothetical protein
MPLSESRAQLNRALLEKGLGWEELRPLVNRWFTDLKEWEAADSFKTAFDDRRMTARQVDQQPRRNAGGNFKVGTVDDVRETRPIRLERDAQGIRERMNPKNFFDPITLKRGKNELGLHNLSASLLDPRRAISTQLKFYKNAYVLFMPLPSEEDMKVYYNLNVLGKTELKGKDDNQIQIIRSQMTRVKLAQASDMGTRYVDIAPESADKSKFRYGITGTIIRDRPKEGEIVIGKPATPNELDARKTNALIYKSILDAMVVSVNEIVIAYRSHASRDFPMFTKRDNDLFRVVNPDTAEPTGWVIADADGAYRRE